MASLPNYSPYSRPVLHSSTRKRNQQHYVTPPKDLKGFPNAKPAKRLGRRKRRVDDDSNIYEWDYQHGAVEKYSKNGKHLGEYDAETGAQNKPGDSQRKPEGK